MNGQIGSRRLVFLGVGFLFALCLCQTTEAKAQFFRRRWSRPAYSPPRYTPPPTTAASRRNRPQPATMPGVQPGSSQVSRLPDISDKTVGQSLPGKTLLPVRVPGEFEPQRAIVLSISDWMPHHFDILTQLAETTQGHTELLILYNDLERVREVVEHLMAADIAGPHVYFAPLELNTIWVRDFGPRVAETPQGPIAIDFFYEGSRPKDDALPVRWAEACSTRLRTVRWTVQGGNLLFNGRGLAVTSERIFKDNAIGFPTTSRPADPQAEARRMVTEQFSRACNLKELVVLEPLQNEITRHVDMFMTFLEQDHVVVGRLDPRRNPINAAILDRNATKLARLSVDGSPMRVSRIDFPSPNGTQWSSMTNIILANDLVLIPSMDTDPPEIIRAAKATYQRLLPNHVVKTVDLTSMKALQGALHCLSMNIPQFATIPSKRYAYTGFRKQLESQN
ncbi:MAG: agmatine deiminase family protein [Planctomycetota bacterium]